VSAAKLPPPAERARIRRESGATLRDVAAELGVSPMTVARWEAGTVHPRLDQAAAYARLLAAIASATNPPATEGDSA
jgi:DNA-binding XRE family transcriptional regulator